VTVSPGDFLIAIVAVGTEWRRREEREEYRNSVVPSETSSLAAKLEAFSAPASIAGPIAGHRRPWPAALPRPPHRTALLEALPPLVRRRPRPSL
jgi:hypothetical protein